MAKGARGRSGRGRRKGASGGPRHAGRAAGAGDLPEQRGRVVETVGRRVRVRRADGTDEVCKLAGHRAVVGDRVRFVDVDGEGGRLSGVEPRATWLRRTDPKGHVQVVAAGLDGLAIVDTPTAPPLSPFLVDRYLAAAHEGGLTPLLVLNKVDLGVPDAVHEEVAAWRGLGLEVLLVSATDGTGLDALAARLAGAWAFVGRSGVGKTSLVRALLPERPADEIGEVAELSAYWGMGRHTTTGSRVFALPDRPDRPAGEIVDSPGIRGFTPGGLSSEGLRRHFPGVRDVVCRYRDCLHREGEEGCLVPEQVPERFVASYRSLLAEVLDIEARARP